MISLYFKEQSLLLIHIWTNVNKEIKEYDDIGINSPILTIT